MSPPRHLLVLGGNGRISRLLTVILLEKSWSVTSLIRTEEQVDDLKKIGAGLPGKHSIIVRDLEKVSSQEKAQAIVDEVKPDSIFWSAGAGATGDQDKVFRIDRDAASNFIRAAVATPTITHFILVSYLGARRAKAPWWTEADWEGWKKVNSTILARYYEAKVAADEVLVTESRKRSKISAVSVRPGGLTENEEGGVIMGQTKQSRGMTSRATTARVSALLLEAQDIKGRWLDVLDGDDDTATEVERCVRDGVECAEGEPAYS
ncbi:Fc.00g019820.m01.CDS01 [Cosmosporella sp. VM-42]